MKSSVRSTAFTAILVILTTGSMFAQTSNVGFEQWYRARYGRPSPTEQARLNSQPSNTASPDATPLLAAQPANSGFEQWYRAKVGRPSPAEEARLHSQPLNSVLPAATQSAVAVSGDAGSEQRYQSKYGRPSPALEAGLGKTSTGEELSKDQLNALIATAKTPAEHQRIARFYQSRTQHYLALSKEHETMLAAYKANPGLTNNKNQASTINHCAYFVREFKALAAQSNELALSHERMATEAASM